jgi:hypothetical protein
MTRLHRKNVAFKADTVNDDGTFSGYASVFGNVDLGGDIVAPGAFAGSIARIATSGRPMPALWQHNQDQPIGGYTNLAEDAKGLRVSGFLMVNEIPLAKQAQALMKAKVVSGLSIGYYIEDSSTDEKTGIRTLKKVDLVEASIVTFPMNVLAQIDQVKCKLAGGTLPTLKEFEALLREAGFSKTQSAAIAGSGLTKLLRSESASESGETGRKLLEILSR